MKRFVALLSAVLLTQAVSSSTPSDSTRPLSSGSAKDSAKDSVAELHPMEVRIRKLYLVRPDLMRYPLPYEVIC